ncbi:hypothetical protein [Corynebacterium rhinophilum]|uniref:hypothetical protein n=1 Tax=Corynebacterium rhinophilum TaxID=3050197 RepID=UPI00254E95F6|nr:hypothetical protein [Corynebacterium sp. MSK192]MDK8698426.1 hypothetical protein [Corynebacterium sp. MSK192]
MSVKTILCVAAVVIVIGLAILVGRRAGQHHDDEPSSNQEVPLSEFPQVSETTFYLDAYGRPTGQVSTSSTSTRPLDSAGAGGSGREEPEPEDLSQSGEEQTMSQESRQDSAQDLVSLVNLQLRILGIHAAIDISRRSSSRQKNDEA